MAIDFLILCLLIISLTINLLALGAFWVTPGLRTTANRFVINLLIVNIIGCVALAPTLFLRSNYNSDSDNGVNDSEIQIEDITKNHYSYMEKHGRDFYEKDDIIKNDTITEATIFKCNVNRCERITIDSRLNGNNEKIIITKMDGGSAAAEEEKRRRQQQNFLQVDIPTVIGTTDDVVDVDVDVDDHHRVMVSPSFGVNNNLPKKNQEETKISKTDQQSSGNSARGRTTPDDGTEQEQKSSNNDSINNNNSLPFIQQDIRCWSLDLVAALGALSVLLIVGDTWCAVTDPLRYHSRISGLKAWIFIAATWILGIFFGVLSALRETTITTTTTLELHQTTNNINNNNNNNSSHYHSHDSSYETSRFIEESLYNTIFSGVYFLIIILLPFGFVCGMYWRIFSEARENGLRMRQNGSSPLLQSALNLAGQHNHHQQQHQHQQREIHHNNNHQSHISIHTNPQLNNISSLNLNKDLHQGASTGGLQMRIDHSDRDGSTKPLLIPNSSIHLQLHKPNNYKNPRMVEKDRNQNNILLTLSAANEDIKRNYSYRHLSILGCSQDLIDSHRRNGIRQVHSSPNLQKFDSNGTVIEIDNNTAHHVLQLPTLHTSPKALGYMTSIRHRLSNASSLFKYREESRAARISILVVIMFLVSYLPYGILVLLQGRVFQLSKHATQLAIFVVLLGNISSPFIFAYRNKRVRRGVKRLFNLDPRAKDRQLQRRGIIAHGQGSLFKGSTHENPSLGTGNNGNGSTSGGTKASLTVHCGSNKLPTYSINTTCKFLKPHSVSGTTGTFLVDLERCHYLKNGFTETGTAVSAIDLFKSKQLCASISGGDVIGKNSNNKNGADDVNEELMMTCDIDDDDDDDDGQSDNSGDNDNSAEKRSILKIVCDSSRKLGCAGGGGHSDASSDFEIEPTDV